MQQNLIIYNSAGNVLKSFLPEQTGNLDNTISETVCISTQYGVDNMYKINRKVVINGSSRWVRASTEQEYADKIIALSTSRTVQQTEKHNFREYANEWFNVYSKPNIETVTANTYKRQIDKYLLPWFGDYCIEEITTSAVQKLFNHMDTAKSTKDKVKIVLNQIFESAVDDGFIDKNPLRSDRLRINGRASKETPPYSVEQMRYIVGHICDVQKPEDKLFISLISLHPLRLEEVLGVQWCDVDFENRTIHICRAVTHPDRNQPQIKETKTEESTRTIALSSIAAGFVLPEKKPYGFIVGGETPLSYTQVRRMCERIKKDMAFEESITPIRFRTTVLTDIYDQTKDIRLTQKSGGHSTPETTLRHYIKGRENLSKSATAIDELYSM